MTANAIAKQALAAIQEIDREAQEKKLKQVESLRSAKAAVHERINELNHQIKLLDDAIVAIIGKAATPATKKGRRTRRDLGDLREKVVNWMQARKGQKFGAGDLTKEFPELANSPMSFFMKPMIAEGEIKTDTTEGIRRTKYFAPDSAA